MRGRSQITLRLALVTALAVTLSTASVVSAATFTVEMKNFAFDPARRTIALGDSVQWHNGSFSDHTSTANLFNLWHRNVASGGNTSLPVTFSRAGRFAYHCEIHGSMRGSVKVRMRASPSSGTLATDFTIRVANVNAATGFRYDIQQRKQGNSFALWRSITAQTTVFEPTSKGTWEFRARYKRTNDGVATGYSPILKITVN